MTDLSWERIKDLKRPVMQKTLYITIVIVLIIGFYLGQNYTLNDAMFWNKDTTASIIESPNFAMIGDFITLRCEKGSSNSICGSKGYLQEGIHTSYMIIWDSGATTHYESAPITNETFQEDRYTISNVTLENHNNARE